MTFRQSGHSRIQSEQQLNTFFPQYGQPPSAFVAPFKVTDDPRQPKSQAAGNQSLFPPPSITIQTSDNMLPADDDKNNNSILRAQRMQKAIKILNLPVGYDSMEVLDIFSKVGAIAEFCADLEDTMLIVFEKQESVHLSRFFNNHYFGKHESTLRISYDITEKDIRHRIFRDFQIHGNPNLFSGNTSFAELNEPESIDPSQEQQLQPQQQPPSRIHSMTGIPLQQQPLQKKYLSVPQRQHSGTHPTNSSVSNPTTSPQRRIDKLDTSSLAYSNSRNNTTLLSIPAAATTTTTNNNLQQQQQPPPLVLSRHQSSQIQQSAGAATTTPTPTNHQNYSRQQSNGILRHYTRIPQQIAAATAAHTNLTHSKHSFIYDSSSGISPSKSSNHNHHHHHHHSGKRPSKHESIRLQRGSSSSETERHKDDGEGAMRYTNNDNDDDVDGDEVDDDDNDDHDDDDHDQDYEDISSKSSKVSSINHMSISKNPKTKRSRKNQHTRESTNAQSEFDEITRFKQSSLKSNSHPHRYLENSTDLRTTTATLTTEESIRRVFHSTELPKLHDTPSYLQNSDPTASMDDLFRMFIMRQQYATSLIFLFIFYLIFIY